MSRRKKKSAGRAGGAGVGAGAVEPASVIATLRALKAGAISGASLDSPSRRACVEHMTLDGYSAAEIAEALGVSERTICRDRSAVREANALQRHPGMADEFAGAALRQAEAAMGRLRRIGREKTAPAAARVDAERGAWGIFADLVRLLQSLGHLPAAAREIRAELTHHTAPPDVEELSRELERIERIQVENGVADGPGLARIAEARRLVARLALSETIESIKEGGAESAPMQGDSEREEANQHD